MKSRSTSILVVGFALGAFLVACSSKRDVEVLPAAQAQSSDASGQAPPGIKKGVKVEFSVVTNNAGVTVGGGAFEPWPVVEEVKGNWVFMRFKLSEFGKSTFPNVGTEYWVNFNNVVQYRTKSD